MRQYEALKLSLYILVPLLSTSSVLYRLRNSWPVEAHQQQQQQHQKRQFSHSSSSVTFDSSSLSFYQTATAAPNHHHQSKTLLSKQDEILINGSCATLKAATRSHQLDIKGRRAAGSAYDGLISKEFPALEHGARRQPAAAVRPTPSLNLLDERASDAEAEDSDEIASVALNFGAKIVIFILMSLLSLVISASVYHRRLLLLKKRELPVNANQPSAASGTADANANAAATDFNRGNNEPDYDSLPGDNDDGGLGDGLIKSGNMLQAAAGAAGNPLVAPTCSSRLPNVGSGGDVSRHCYADCRLTRRERPRTTTTTTTTTRLTREKEFKIRTSEKRGASEESTAFCGDAAAAADDQREDLSWDRDELEERQHGFARLHLRGADSGAEATTKRLIRIIRRRRTTLKGDHRSPRSMNRHCIKMGFQINNNNNNKCFQEHKQQQSMQIRINNNYDQEIRKQSLLIVRGARDSLAPLEPARVNNNNNENEKFIDKPAERLNNCYLFQNLVKEIFLSFSVYKNASLILDSGENKHNEIGGANSKDLTNKVNDVHDDNHANGKLNTDCLHGLRFISMLWVIMIHSYSFALDWLQFDRDPRMEPFNIYKSYLGQMLSNGSFACDTFLMIAGFLLAYLSISDSDSSNNDDDNNSDQQSSEGEPEPEPSERHNAISRRSSSSSSTPLATLVKSSSMSSLDSGLSDDCSQSSASVSSGFAGLNSLAGRSSVDASWENDSFSDSSSSSSSSSRSSDKHLRNLAAGTAASSARKNKNNLLSSPITIRLDYCDDYVFQRSFICKSRSRRTTRLPHNNNNNNNNLTLHPNDDTMISHLVDLPHFAHVNKKPVSCQRISATTNNKYNMLESNESLLAADHAHDTSRGDDKFTFAKLLANLLHRYLRMMPLMMAIIALNTNLLAYFGSGPKYNSSTLMFDRWCRTNWWLNLIFIHNFAGSKHMCLGHSWYSAVDFQLFIVGQVLLFIFYKLSSLSSNASYHHELRSPNKSATASFVSRHKHYILSSLCLLLITCSQLYTGLITYFYQLPMIPMMPNFSLESNILYCVKIYIKPYCRASPYFIGFLLAYYMRLNKGNLKLNKLQVFFGWSLSLATMLAIVLTTTPIFNGLVPNFTFIALYGSLARPIWSCAIGWVIFASITNNGGLLGKLLAAKCLIPFSRLNYPVFLIHPVIIAAFYGSRQSYFQFSHYLMFCLILGFVVITYASAFVLSLIFELPAQSMEKAIRKYNKSKRQMIEQQQQQAESSIFSRKSGKLHACQDQDYDFDDYYRYCR